MKNFFLFISFLFLQTYFCVGKTQPKDSLNKVEFVKKAYMNRELNLTPDEEKNFWPVYNNYVKDIKSARQEYSNDEVGFTEKVAQIRRKYKGEFGKVLKSDARTNNVFSSERKFRDLLKQEQAKRQKFRKQGSGQFPKKQKRN